MTALVRDGVIQDALTEDAPTVGVDLEELFGKELKCESKHLDKGPACLVTASWFVDPNGWCNCGTTNTYLACDARRVWLGKGFYRCHLCHAIIHGSAWVATWRPL
jgi:hypothetical protein